MSKKSVRIILCCFMGLFGLKAGLHTARLFEVEWYVTAGIMLAYAVFGFGLLWLLTRRNHDV